MQIKTKIASVLAAFIVVLPLVGSAQTTNGINAFSPYTLYGIGELTVPGGASSRAMGGSGVALSSAYQINTLNPAASSFMLQKTVLFNVGLEAASFYDKNKTQKTSYYTGNLQNISLQLPLARKIGFMFSLSPLSNVGYRITEYDRRPEILANIGQVAYKYAGEGGVSQFSGGIGMQIFKNFAIGAELIYYLGNINRYYDTEITPITGTGSFFGVSAWTKEHISRISGRFGFQYCLKADMKRVFAIGATYQPATSLRPQAERFVQSGNIFGDTVILNNYGTNLSIPHTVTAGLFYATTKLGLTFDYSFQGWANSNQDDPANGVGFTNTHSVRAGVQIIPNALDARRAMRRWSYRFGYRYNTYYMTFKGQAIRDNAITLGLGIPLKMAGGTSLNLALDMGIRGTTRYELIQEKYLKLSIGFNFFAAPEEGWFHKRKYR